MTVKRGPDVPGTAGAVAEPQSRPWLLDTSAILTFIEDEAGADRVEEALKQATTIVPWPVLLELHYISLREEGQAEADRRIALIKQLNVRMIWDMDEATLLTASRLKAEYPVSLADALIAAFSIRAGAVLMHKDPEFDALSGLLPMEALDQAGINTDESVMAMLAEARVRSGLSDGEAMGLALSETLADRVEQAAGRRPQA